MEFYADDCDFRDFPLEHNFLNDKPGLARAFIPFANADPANGRGIHHFEATEYHGDEKSGVVLWRWTARHCPAFRSEEHTSELQSLMRISYAVFCLKKKNKNIHHRHTKYNRNRQN